MVGEGRPCYPPSETTTALGCERGEILRDLPDRAGRFEIVIVDFQERNLPSSRPGSPIQPP